MSFYYLGCPVWANKEWCGTLFSRRAKSHDYLRQYARTFNSVEGSATFYSLPATDTLLRWKHETPETFRFVFKFPRLITHDCQLKNMRDETLHFFNTMQPIASRIGMLFLQLPPSFGRKSLPLLAQYIGLLSADYTYAVEVRHRDFFDNANYAQELDQLLAKHQINRAVFDTATLHQLADNDELTLEAKRKKPKMPTYFSATAQCPMLRYVGHQLPEYNVERLQYLAQIVAEWIMEGKKPYVYFHSPGDLYAPQICRLFHGQLSQILLPQGIDIGRIPPFMGELENDQAQQISIF
jgi:uncharacterized protein YecE (DUF72 family)